MTVLARLAREARAYMYITRPDCNGSSHSADMNRWTNKVVFTKDIKAKEEKKERTGGGVLERYLYTNGSPYFPYSPKYGS